MRGIIRQLIPLNILEEREKFFADTTYNPQLVYERTFSPEELTAWGIPHPKLVEHVRAMLQQHPAVNEPNPTYISEDYVRERIQEFNTRYAPPVPLTVVFSPHQVARCRIEETHIYFLTPMRYTAVRFEDLYRHELETHALRRLNHQSQPWANEEPNEITFRRTEEGLANLHTFLLRENKILRKSYITYLAVACAQTGSFRDVFDEMVAQGISPTTAWNIALRTKRGLTDTARPGGLTKDICYYEGTLLVWRWLMDTENDPHDLYLGRLSLEQIAARRDTARRDHLRFPSFFANMDEYRALITEVGTVNGFERVLTFMEHI